MAGDTQLQPSGGSKDQAQPERLRRRGGSCRPPIDAELGIQVRDVAFHGTDTEDQIIRDLAVAAPPRDQTQDLGFPLRET